jgi:hypothetical protein
VRISRGKFFVFLVTIALLAIGAASLPQTAAIAQTTKSLDGAYTLTLPDRITMIGDALGNQRSGCEPWSITLSHSSGVVPLRARVSVFIKDALGTTIDIGSVEAERSGLPLLTSTSDCFLAGAGELVGPYVMTVLGVITGDYPVSIEFRPAAQPTPTPSPTASPSPSQSSSSSAQLAAAIAENARLQTELSNLQSSVSRLEMQLTRLQAQYTLLQKKLSKVCANRPKPRGC